MKDPFRDNQFYPPIGINLKNQTSPKCPFIVNYQDLYTIHLLHLVVMSLKSQSLCYKMFLTGSCFVVISYPGLPVRESYRCVLSHLAWLDWTRN